MAGILRKKKSHYYNVDASSALTMEKIAIMKGDAYAKSSLPPHISSLKESAPKTLPTIFPSLFIGTLRMCRPDESGFLSS